MPLTENEGVLVLVVVVLVVLVVAVVVRRASWIHSWQVYSKTRQVEISNGSKLLCISRKQL